MSIVSKVAQAMQEVLTDVAESLARELGVVCRQRKFDGATLTQTLVLGFLANPKASWKDLAVMARRRGVDVSEQAIAQRFTPTLLNYLKQLIEVMAARCIAAQPVACELLRRFTGVFLTDSTVASLPETFADVWPGCGGRPGGGGKAGLKFQLTMDWLTGGLSHLGIEPARDPDQKSSVQKVTHPRGSLRIADLGYFCVKTLKKIADDGAYFLSRIQSGTAVFDQTGQPISLLRHLNQVWQGMPIEQQILLGAEVKLPCRLIAIRLPEEVANRRRQKLHAECQRKNRQVSQERLAWCDWTIYVTNVEPERMNWKECLVLYRTRWQIELIFKLWKSEGKLVDRTPGPPVRQVAILFARMLAMILQHWMLLCSVWHRLDRSLRKAAKHIREFAIILASALSDFDRLVEELTILGATLERVARLDPRRQKPNHHQMLENPDLLEYSLT